MKNLDTEQMKRMRDSDGNLVVINVLGEEPFRKEHIPGSVNVPVDSDDFESRVRQLAGGKDRSVVVYCASEDCTASPKAAKKLDQAGFSKVHDYEGGMKAWKEAGLPVEGQGAGA